MSCWHDLSNAGILGRSWRPLWEPESPRLAAVRPERLTVGLTPTPDGSESLEGGIDRADATISSRSIVWNVQNGTSRPIFWGLPEPVSHPNQLRNGIDVSHDLSGTVHARKWKPSRKKSRSECVLYRPGQPLLCQPLASDKRSMSLSAKLQERRRQRSWRSPSRPWTG